MIKRPPTLVYSSFTKLRNNKRTKNKCTPFLNQQSCWVTMGGKVVAHHPTFLRSSSLSWVSSGGLSAQQLLAYTGRIPKTQS